MEKYGLLRLISIHALLAESDTGITRTRLAPAIFLSTLSLRRATSKIPLHCLVIHNFYPRSPCGERHILSIRTIGFLGFLSTLSLRRATIDAEEVFGRADISIHALLAESDRRISNPHSALAHFYPRSPCGERQARLVDQQKRPHISIHALLAESDLIFSVADLAA